MYLVYILNYNVLFFNKQFEALIAEILFKHKGTFNKAQYEVPLAYEVNSSSLGSVSYYVINADNALMFKGILEKLE